MRLKIAVSVVRFRPWAPHSHPSQSKAVQNALKNLRKARFFGPRTSTWVCWYPLQMLVQSLVSAQYQHFRCHLLRYQHGPDGNGNPQREARRKNYQVGRRKISSRPGNHFRMAGATMSSMIWPTVMPPTTAAPAAFASGCRHRMRLPPGTGRRRPTRPSSIGRFTARLCEKRLAGTYAATA
jgi:hypothetical protein